MNTRYTLAMIALALSSASVARADFVVVTAKSGTIKTATMDEVRALFLGKGTKVGGVSAKAADCAAVKAEFSKKVLDKDPDALRAYWAKQVFTGAAVPPAEMANDAAMKVWLAANPAGVGYVSGAGVDDSVIVLAKP